MPACVFVHRLGVASGYWIWKEPLEKHYGDKQREADALARQAAETAERKRKERLARMKAEVAAKLKKAQQEGGSATQKGSSVHTAVAEQQGSERDK